MLWVSDIIVQFFDVVVYCFNNCFSIFAGTAVICNYMLMITWLPAAVSLVERFASMRRSLLCKRPLELLFKLVDNIGSRFEKVVVRAVDEFPFVWIGLFGTVGILSCVCVLYWPKLELPDSPDFKLFKDQHPFELYDSVYRHMFWFERASVSNSTLILDITTYL